MMSNCLENATEMHVEFHFFFFKCHDYINRISFTYIYTQIWLVMSYSIIINFIHVG